MAYNMPVSKSRMATIRQTHEGEHYDDFGEVPVTLTFAVMAYSLAAAANSCAFGYEIAIRHKLADLAQEDLEFSNDKKRLFLGCLEFYAMFGAAASWYFADKHGRRYLLIVANAVSIFGAAVTSIAGSFGHLMFGEMISGLALGLGLMVDPLYIAEMSPAKYRGYLVSWSEFGLTCGFILGANTSVGTDGLPDSVQWRVMRAVSSSMPVVLIFLAIKILPESPRWLVMQKRLDEARAVLTQIYGLNFDTTRVIQSMEDAIQRDIESVGAGGWRALAHPTPAYARMLTIGLVTGSTQQMIGYNALHYFIIDTVYESGLKAKDVEDVFLVGLGFCNLLWIYIGGKLLDRTGRKKVMMISAAACGMVLWIFSITFMGNHEPTTNTRFIIIFSFFIPYGLGLGPGSAVVASEVFSITLRAKGMAAATALNMFFSLGCRIVFSPLARNFGWESVFAIYGLVGLLLAAYFHIFVPETKGRSLEEMAVYFSEITGDARVLEIEATVVERRRNEAQEGGNATSLPPSSQDVDPNTII